MMTSTQPLSKRLKTLHDSDKELVCWVIVAILVSVVAGCLMFYMMHLSVSNSQAIPLSDPANPLNPIWQVKDFGR